MDERRAESTEILQFVARASEKLETIHGDIVELKVRVGIQNGRIFKIEKWQAFIFGGCALLGVIASILSILVVWIKK